MKKNERKSLRREWKNKTPKFKITNNGIVVHFDSDNIKPQNECVQWKDWEIIKIPDEITNDEFQ